MDATELAPGAEAPNPPHDHSGVLAALRALAAALAAARPEKAALYRAEADLSGVDLVEESATPGMRLEALLHAAWFRLPDRAAVFAAADALTADEAAWAAEGGWDAEHPLEDALFRIGHRLADVFIDAIGHDVLFGSRYVGYRPDPNRVQHAYEADAALIEAIHRMDAYSMRLIERGAYPPGDERRLPDCDAAALVAGIGVLADRLDRHHPGNHLGAWARREVARLVPSCPTGVAVDGPA